ncbi:MAG: aromatic ring-hydroxylating dioxygenase subunit alpha [Chloroflexota bacterium]
MIPDQWYVVLESSEIKAGKPFGVKRMGEQLVFWRDEQGKVHCLRDVCPHRGVALSKGKVLDSQLQCPFHGFEFDGSGQCCKVPANGINAPLPKQIKAHSYPTYEEHGFIFIWWGDGTSERTSPRFFDDLDGLFYTPGHDEWKTHYSRVIENQLDVAHLPFVHANSIGRGDRTLVDGPLTIWEDEDRFKVYVFNRADDGTPPRKPDDLSVPDVPFHLDFIFPNLWQNHISEQVRIVVAFVPVDDEHTRVYLRFYQSFMKLPILRTIVGWLSMPGNLYILHQDRGVVQTHVPKRSELKMGEKLIQADRSIVHYRKRRQALIDRATEK